MEDTLLRRLENCFEAYQQFPIDHRFERFKSKKQYFLEGKSDAEQMKIYHEFVFYHYVLCDHLVPKVSKAEILKYYYQRKNEQIKSRALKYVFDNIYSNRIFPQKSFNEFRKENMYFICHLSVKEQMREFEFFKFYEKCRELKLPVDKGDIQQFMLDREGTKKGTTND